MKVGDLVQKSDAVIRSRGLNVLNRGRRVGVVLEINEIPEEVRVRNQGWAGYLGRTVKVLWNSGSISGFAENSLEVISE